MNVLAVAPLLLSLAVPQDPSPADTLPGHVVLTGATLSTRDVQLGEPFELAIVARIPPGHIVYFPDTLETRNGIESAAAARWTAEPIGGDSAELTIVYALRSFVGGALALPEPQIVLHRPLGGRGLTAEAAGGVAPRAEPAVEAASVQVGRWADVATLEPGRFTRRMIVPASVRVGPVLPLERPREGFSPRPAADVVGGDWSPPVLGLLGFVALIVLGTTGLAAQWTAARIRPWLTARRPEVAPRPQSPRDRALADLDAILAEGLQRSGRLDELYTRGAHAVRRYLAVVEAGCTPALTDRELIAHLLGVAGASRIAALGGVLLRAEVVRFGVHRPDPREAEADVTRLRDWVREYPVRDYAQPPGGSAGERVSE
ncbi:MAG: hypothetical protein HY701_12085 [Gemmatimonadetes bacterium]|nr:hypothetical protein [Gemmatimonadota bacterium]